MSSFTIPRLGLWVICLVSLGSSIVVGQENSSERSGVAAEPKQGSVLEAKQLRTTTPVELDYLIAFPDKYESKQSWPLLLFLHGAGERGNNLELVKKHGPPKLVAQGKKLPFIIVAPQCPRNRWWEPVSLSALLDEIEAKYKVDPSRIYVTGLSMGGFGTWNLAAHTPDRFAAIAPVCGGGDAFSVPYRIKNQIPVWNFHGAKDRVVPLSRSEELAEGFKKMGVEIKMTVYPDAGHDSWTETYDNEKLYEWFLSNQRNKDKGAEKDAD